MTLAQTLRSKPLTNAAYGIAEYVSQPILMLCSAPYLLHRLGTEQYAIWILASAAVTGGTLLSAGFGDAAVKYISDCRGRNDHAGVEQIIRTLLTLNLAFSSVFALLLLAATPFLARHLPKLTTSQSNSYQQALIIGAILLIVKSAENVFISAQRAYERYGIATRISISARASTIFIAVVLAALGYGTLAIMVSTLAIAIVSLASQAYAAMRDMQLTTLTPSCDRVAAKHLFSFGAFSWLQGLTALLSGQADRLIVGYMLGTQALAYYSICIQIALPIHGIAAAGLQVLFPYLGSRLKVTSLADARKKLFSAFTANAALVIVLAAPVIFGSHFILLHWLGRDVATQAALTLAMTACSSALLGLNVTGHFFLLALGRIRLLCIINLAGALAMLSAIAWLAPKFGISGAAAGRLIYGPITWIAYYSLYRSLHHADDSSTSTHTLQRICELS